MRLLACALACLLLAIAPARADEIAIAAGDSFQHRHTRLVIPPRLAGLPRIRASQFAPDQLDVVMNYADPAGGEIVTVFVYRLASGSLPLWFDRAKWSIEQGGAYGKVVSLARDPAFAPPGQDHESGLVAVYAAEGRLTSTALVLVPLGDWLVKLRLSSASLSPEQLQTRIASVLLELKWPRRIPAAAAAVPVAECPAPLKIGERAAAAAANPLDGMIGAIVGSALAETKGKKAAPAIWCRDPTVIDGGWLYRSNGETDGYLFAFSDAGRAIRVQPTLLTQLSKQGDGKDDEPPAWSVDFIDLGQIVSFAPVAGLPPPAQTVEMLTAGKYVSIAPTWGDKRAVTVNTDAVR